MHRAVCIVFAMCAVACGDSNPAGPDAGGTGAACGGASGEGCASTHFCDYRDKSCGFNDATGECAPRPVGCDDVLEPACGCDGVVHPNACEANALGVDESQLGSCTTPDARFECGEHFCVEGTEYCQVLGSDIIGQASGYSCEPMPAACDSCDCLGEEPCGRVCRRGDDGNFELTCPGG